ncbi:MAG: hypothetical protein VYA51_12830 [Planctomycetota bacterium]|nr:hypothetical protein [Planctomycetota bacterium]
MKRASLIALVLAAVACSEPAGPARHGDPEAGSTGDGFRDGEGTTGEPEGPDPDGSSGYEADESSSGEGPDPDSSSSGGPDDPCADMPHEPGITLRADHVAVPDLCISLIPGVDGCFIAKTDEPGTVRLWCDFECGTTEIFASYPAVGEEYVQIPSPC